MEGGKKLAFLLPDMGGGGAERVALALISHWAAAGHHVDLLLQRKEGALLQLIPPEVRVLDLQARRLRHVIRPLVSYFKTAKPDAIQISMWPLTIIGMIAHWLARSRSRVVLSEHSSLSKQYEELTGLPRLWLTRGIAFFYPRADARVAVSERAAADLALLATIERASIDVIYNPVAQPTQDPRADDDVHALWGTAHPRILTVGRLSAEKNHTLLIQAFAKLRRDRPAKLMIVGDGPLRKQLLCIAQEAGVADDVYLAGFALDPWAYLRSADLFVLSSNFEGFGLVLVEAMLCGLPIVSTDCESGPREILKDGQYGALVPCRDVEALAAAIEGALAMPVDRGRQMERGRLLSGTESAQRYLGLMLGPEGKHDGL